MAEIEKNVPEKEPKKKGISKGALIGIIVAGVIVLAVAAFAVVAFISGNSAVTAYNEGAKALKAGDAEKAAQKFEEAYDGTGMALFMDSKTKDAIAKKYVEEVLCKNGEFFTAAEILEDTGLSAKEKDKIYAANPDMAMCKEGQVVKFGKYESDNNQANGPEEMEWIVLEVTEENGRARALLLSKDVIASPGGWNKIEGNTSYANSNLHDWCQNDFYNTFTMYDATLRTKILKMKVSTPGAGDDVEASVYAPTKAELDKYLKGDLAKYIKASATASAKAAGVSARGDVAAYYVRDLGDVEKGYQWAAGFSNKGEFNKAMSPTGNGCGARVCINVDLGEVK